MDNKKRLKRKVNAKLKTVLLMLLAIMFVISSLITVSAATIKDDGKYTLLLTCGLNGPDGKIDGEYSKMIKFDVADGDTTVSLSELTAGILRLTAELNLLIGQRIGRAKQKSQKIYRCPISTPRAPFI